MIDSHRYMLLSGVVSWGAGQEGRAWLDTWVSWERVRLETGEVGDAKSGDGLLE